jgi:hypothetical protein
MPHFVFSTSDSGEKVTLGAVFDIDFAEADRIASWLMTKRLLAGMDRASVDAEEVAVIKPPSVPLPDPPKKGDVITGVVAGGLPCGSAIKRVRNREGVAIHSRWAMVQTPAGWVSGDGHPNPRIAERDHYRVLHLGAPALSKTKGRQR